MIQEEAYSITARNIPLSVPIAIGMRASEMQRMGIDAVKLSVGEPDYNTPDHICEAAKQTIDSRDIRYTVPAGTWKLREAVCRKLASENHLRYTPDQIVMCNGVRHAMALALEAILNPGDEVIIPMPAWNGAIQIVRMLGGVVVPVKTTAEEDYQPDADKLREAVNFRTKAILINTPNNPTGAVYTEETLRGIAAVAEEYDLFIISDEIYEHIIFDEVEHYSIASISNSVRERTITINGCSKTYAMTGWRVGYAACNCMLAQIMTSIINYGTHCVNSVSQAAGLAALEGPQDSVEEMRAEYERRRDDALARLEGMPYIRVFRPRGSFFIYINVEKTFSKTFRGHEIWSDMDFSAYLLQHFYVATVCGSTFGDSTSVRLALTTAPEQIGKALDRLEQYLTELQ